MEGMVRISMSLIDSFIQHLLRQKQCLTHGCREVSGQVSNLRTETNTDPVKQRVSLADEWVNNIGLCTYNGVLFGLKKEGDSDILTCAITWIVALDSQGGQEAWLGVNASFPLFCQLP